MSCRQYVCTYATLVSCAKRNKKLGHGLQGRHFFQADEEARPPQSFRLKRERMWERMCVWEGSDQHFQFCFYLCNKRGEGGLVRKDVDMEKVRMCVNERLKRGSFWSSLDSGTDAHELCRADVVERVDPFRGWSSERDVHGYGFSGCSRYDASIMQDVNAVVCEVKG